MSEAKRSVEPISEGTVLRSVLASFTIGVLMNTNRQYFHDDLSEAIGYVDENKNFATGQPITQLDLDAIASASILAQIADSFGESSDIELETTVPRSLGTFTIAQAVIDVVGLTGNQKKSHIPTALATVRRIKGLLVVPTDPVIEAAVEVWRRRGEVDMEMESVADIIDAARTFDSSVTAPDKYYEVNGLQVEEYPASGVKIPTRVERIPYYSQFYEVEHGREWLASLLEDLKSIHQASLQAD